MRAGLLTEWLDVLTPRRNTINALGEQETEYSCFTHIRARDVSHRQSRVNENGQMWFPSTKIFEVRLYQDIKETDIIEWRGKKYRIIDIEVDRQQMCKRLTVDEINQ